MEGRTPSSAQGVARICGSRAVAFTVRVVARSSPDECVGGSTSRPKREPPPLGRLLAGQKGSSTQPGAPVNRKPTLMAELIAEFLGTFVLMLFGIGVVAVRFENFTQ